MLGSKNHHPSSENVKGWPFQLVAGQRGGGKDLTIDPGLSLQGGKDPSLSLQGGKDPGLSLQGGTGFFFPGGKDPALSLQGGKDDPGFFFPGGKDPGLLLIFLPETVCLLLFLIGCCPVFCDIKMIFWDFFFWIFFFDLFFWSFYVYFLC